MPHTPHICLALRCCQLSQYSLRFGYIACRCMCFSNIIFYRSEIYCPIFTLSSTMPSVPHSLGCSIIGLRWFILLICIIAILALISVDITGSTIASVLPILYWSMIGLRCFFLNIRIVAILALISIDITGSQAKPVEFSFGPLLPAASGDGIALITFVTLICVIPAAPWHPEMQFVFCTIVVYLDFWVSAFDNRLLKRHFGGQIVKKNSIVKTCCFHFDHKGMHWVLRLSDLTFDCSKSVFIHPLLVAFQ